MRLLHITTWMNVGLTIMCLNYWFHNQPQREPHVKLACPDPAPAPALPPPCHCPPDPAPPPCQPGHFVDGDKVFDLGAGTALCADTILYGYDVMFERLQLYSEGTWLGVPNQQDPQDAMVMAELIATERPDVIVELGTNEGGGALFYASIMELEGHGEVITIDPADFRAGGWTPGRRCDKIRCRKADESHVWRNRVTFMQGLPASLVDTVRERTRNKTVWVIEDGNHEYATVTENVNAYAPLVTPGGLLQIQDTKLTRMRCADGCAQRNGPMHAMEDFMKTDLGRLGFVHDRSLEYYRYTQHAKGWLRRVP